MLRFIIGLNIAGIIFASSFYLHNPMAEWIQFGIIAILIIGSILRSNKRPPFLVKLIAGGSNHTYTMYLIHFPVLLLFFSLSNSHFTEQHISGFELFLSSFLIINLLSILISKIVERPFLRNLK